MQFFSVQNSNVTIRRFSKVKYTAGGANFLVGQH